MDRSEPDSSSKLEVEIAKARLRVAVASVRPGRSMAQSVRRSPLASVGSALALGLLLGAVPQARRGLPVMVASLLRRFT